MNDCDIILEYRDCGAVIAISDVDDHTIVAFRGTFETTQLAEQVLGVLLKLTESPIGGEIRATHICICAKYIILNYINHSNRYLIAP